jgi:hypothetical protein
MYKIHDVLIPSRFITFSLQVILTIVIMVQRKDNINADMIGEIDYDSNYKSKQKTFIAYMVFFYVFEACEFIIMLWGLTLFNNILSVAQIFFHSVCVLLLDWYIHEIYSSYYIYEYFIIGGIVPILLECISIFSMNIYHRRFTKIE